MKITTAALTVTTLLLAACSRMQNPEQIVTSTAHCTAVTLKPDLMMRLSSYSGYPDSIKLWVVQACHPTGTNCLPILTYDHAPPPLYSVSGDKVTITLLGGQDRYRIHNQRVQMGSRSYEFRVHPITGDVGDRGVHAFLSKVQHRCPPGNRQYPA